VLAGYFSGKTVKEIPASDVYAFVYGSPSVASQVQKERLL